MEVGMRLDFGDNAPYLRSILSSFHFFKRTRWRCIIGCILSCTQEAERSPLVNFLLGMDHVQRKQKVRPSKWDVQLEVEAHGMIF